MRYPEFLKDGGTIGFVAPSFGCATEPYRTGFDHALTRFRELGYHVLLGENCYAAKGIGISNTPRACGQELKGAFEGEADVLISCGGGELMCEVLDYVDFEALKAGKPKWYMGYSDNTNLTFLLNIICDTAAIYGPCAASFGMEPWHSSISDALAVLRGERQTLKGYDRWEKESGKDEEHPLEPYYVTEPRVIRLYRGMEQVKELAASGRMIGGCLDCLENLVGTKFDRVREFAGSYEKEGILWFLESCDLNVFGVRRALWHMRQAGWFENARGFLIGRPGCMGQEMMGLDQYSAVTGVLGELGVPILMDLDIGHLPPQMPLISGAFGEVYAANQDLTLNMKLV